MKKNHIGLKIFLLAVAEICLVLLILFLTMMIDQRICAALFSLCVVIAAFFATWYITEPAAKKRVAYKRGLPHSGGRRRPLRGRRRNFV